MSDIKNPQTFAEAEAILAETLPAYEARPQQQALAKEIEAALEGGYSLLAEAGCGTGKSIGYLIPAIISGKQTVVSTATKALQDQVANKDLPFLKESLGIDFSYALLKGRSNYVCRAKVAESTEPVAGEVQVFITKDDKDGPTFDGERDNLPFTIEDDRDWRKLTTSGEECPGKKKCPFGAECYAEWAKKKAKTSDVIVVNHALLMTDLMVRLSSDGNASMLPDYAALIVDEAHELEEWAASMMGTRLSLASITNIIGEVANFVGSLPDAQDFTEPNREVHLVATNVWELLQEGRIRPISIVDGEVPTDLGEALVTLAQVMNAYAEKVADISLDAAGFDNTVVGKHQRLMTKVFNLRGKVADLIVADFDQLVRWVEVEETFNGQVRKSILTAPIEVSGILRNNLWGRTPAVLVSATLAVGNGFDYIANRLGLDHYQSIDVGTPFNYAEQALLYVPRHLPKPAGDTKAVWDIQSRQEMYELVKASEGSALLLFTSTKAMNEAYDAIAHRLPYTCLKQGDASNKALAQQFEEDKHSVLFALRSFYTGVDFQGDTLRLVVMDKLPFPVPTEPLFEARCEVIDKRGGNSFSDYTIPFMTLILKQGFGRLIRHRKDSGTVAILDPRLLAGYGGKILRSLPPAERAFEFPAVERFFQEAA